MEIPKFNIGDVVTTKNEHWVISSIKMIELVEDGEIKYRIGGPNLYKGRELELYQKYIPTSPETTDTPIENKQDFCKRFSDIIQEGIKYGDIENLLGWTLGTIGKRYDEEEQYDTIKDDTQEWVEGKADYMND